MPLSVDILSEGSDWAYKEGSIGFRIRPRGTLMNAFARRAKTEELKAKGEDRRLENEERRTESEDPQPKTQNRRPKTEDRELKTEGEDPRPEIQDPRPETSWRSMQALRPLRPKPL